MRKCVHPINVWETYGVVYVIDNGVDPGGGTRGRGAIPVKRPVFSPKLGWSRAFSFFMRRSTDVTISSVYSEMLRSLTVNVFDHLHSFQSLPGRVRTYLF